MMILTVLIVPMCVIVWMVLLILLVLMVPMNVMFRMVLKVLVVLMVLIVFLLSSSSLPPSVAEPFLSCFAVFSQFKSNS